MCNPEVKGNMWGKFSKHLTFFEFCLESLVPFIQLCWPLWLIKPDLLAQYTRLLECTAFEELNVNESGTRGFNFPRNSHVLEMKGAVSGQICRIYLTQKYSPPHSCPPSKSFRILVNVKPWRVLENLETWSGLSSWNAPTELKGQFMRG